MKISQIVKEKHFYRGVKMTQTVMVIDDEIEILDMLMLESG